MDSKLHNQLEEAKVHFYAWRLLECYHILRRYFDRLPFQPEKEHAEYIGMFVRVLLELGKEFEIKFYMRELERLYESSRSPHVGYALSVVYCFSPEPRKEKARTIFEHLVKDPSAREFHAKAKMMLAHYYDSVKDDSGTCRLIIESIEEPDDPELKTLLEIWRAKILGDRGQSEAAEEKYRQLLSRLDPELNWYAYTSASLGLAFVYLSTGDIERAKLLVVEIRKLFEGRSFKLLLARLDMLESQLEKESRPSTIFIKCADGCSVVSHGNKTIELKKDSSVEKLLLLLAKKRQVDKESIVKTIYERDYAGEKDDKLIYYHIHSLRKHLKEMGLPGNAIEFNPGGYRMLARIERVMEDQ